MNTLQRPSSSTRNKRDNKFDVELTTDGESDEIWHPRENDSCGNGCRSRLRVLKYTAAALIFYIAGYLTCAVFAGSQILCRPLVNADFHHTNSAVLSEGAIRESRDAIAEDPTSSSEESVASDPKLIAEDPDHPTEEGLIGLDARKDMTVGDEPQRIVVKPGQCPDLEYIRKLIGKGLLLGPFPWGCLPKEVQLEYTMQNKAVFINYYLDGDHNKGQVQEAWEMGDIEEYWRKANKGEDLSPAYCGASSYFLRSFNRFPVEGKNALVIGSIKPWVEALLLMSKAAEPVTTIDFNPPISNTDKILVRNASLLKDAGPEDAIYDVICSFSSLEHDGLGRYGDPINPQGDRESLEKIKGLLKPGGLFYFSVPIGQDLLAFNAHRVYGQHRLSWLLSGWKLMGMFGRAESLKVLWQLPHGPGQINDCGPNPNWEQPVLVLKLDDGKLSPCCGARVPCHFCHNLPTPSSK